MVQHAHGATRATGWRITLAIWRTLLLGALTWVDAAATDRVLSPWCEQLYRTHTSGAARGLSWSAAHLPSSPLLRSDAELLAAGRVRVQLDTGPGGAPAATLREHCRSAAASLTWEGDVDRVAQVVVDIADLARLAQVPGLFCILRPPTGMPLYLSEGVAEMGAGGYHQAGYRGEGITIGILDVGFAGANDLLGIELPADTQMRSFWNSPSGGGDITGGGLVHGTACAEIVHDVAPGAKMLLSNAASLTEMEAATRWMRDEGASIISHSVGWFFGPGDGTGPIADVVLESIQSDIVWVNAAGNQAQAYYGGRFHDTDGDGLHEFDATGDSTITEHEVDSGTEFFLVLSWNRWPYSPDLTYEIDIYEDGRWAASSDQALTPEGYAYRELAYPVLRGGSTIDIVIRRKKGSDDVELRLFRLDDGNPFAEHRTPAGSLVIPADTPEVLTAGAYGMTGENRYLRSYSSRGPTLSGLAKPEICALDGVTNYSIPGFQGTSAACPHVAGAAALLLTSAPRGGFFDFRWSQKELRSILAWSALEEDLGDASACGWGLLRLPNAREPSAEAQPRVLLSSPARPPVLATIRGGAPGPLCLVVFDALGRKVGEQHVLLAPGSPPVVTWNGTDARGRPLPNGLYLLAARGQRWQASGRVMLLR